MTWSLAKVDLACIVHPPQGIQLMLDQTLPVHYIFLLDLSLIRMLILEDGPACCVMLVSYVNHSRSMRGTLPDLYSQPIWMKGTAVPACAPPRSALPNSATPDCRMPHSGHCAFPAADAICEEYSLKHSHLLLGDRQCVSNGKRMPHLGEGKLLQIRSSGNLQIPLDVVVVRVSTSDITISMVSHLFEQFSIRCGSQQSKKEVHKSFMIIHLKDATFRMKKSSPQDTPPTDMPQYNVEVNLTGKVSSLEILHANSELLPLHNKEQSTRGPNVNLPVKQFVSSTDNALAMTSQYNVAESLAEQKCLEGNKYMDSAFVLVNGGSIVPPPDNELGVPNPIQENPSSLMQNELNVEDAMVLGKGQKDRVRPPKKWME